MVETLDQQDVDPFYLSQW